MTNEGMLGQPMDEVEVREAVANLAKMAQWLYAQALKEGFTESQAMAVVQAYVHGTSGGKLS